MEDDFFAGSRGGGPSPQPWTPARPSTPPRVTTTRTRATSTSFGLVGRLVITVAVLILPGIAIVVALDSGGGLLAADPFQAGSLLVTLAFAGYVIRATWKPAKRVRR